MGRYYHKDRRDDLSVAFAKELFLLKNYFFFNSLARTFLPFLILFFKTRLPPAVDMRFINPWQRTRFLTFG